MWPIFAFIVVVFAMVLILNSSRRKNEIEINESKNLFGTDINVGAETDVRVYGVESDTIPDNYIPPPTADAREPWCPNCGAHLDVIPDQRKKCPECWKYIYAYSVEIDWVWTKKLTPEEEWKVYNKKQREERFAIEEESRRLAADPDYVCREIDEMTSNGFSHYSRVVICWSGCDHCMHMMNKSLSIKEAKALAWKHLSDQCECPYHFRPDPSSAQY